MAQETDNPLDKLESEQSDPWNKSYSWEIWIQIQQDRNHKPQKEPRKQPPTRPS